MDLPVWRNYQSKAVKLKNLLSFTNFQISKTLKTSISSTTPWMIWLEMNMWDLDQSLNSKNLPSSTAHLSRNMKEKTAKSFTWGNLSENTSMWKTDQTTITISMISWSGAMSSIQTSKCLSISMEIHTKFNVILCLILEKKEIKEIIKNEVKQVEMKKGTGMVKVKIYF